ncbi:MAG: ester cyclase [Asgard group archaeon]|nr:ester cyclase [Asgard group archaeon]
MVFMNDKIEDNKRAATRLIEAFNNDDWDEVLAVTVSNYTLHHPLGGTISAGPEALINEWKQFKAALPDSWHPIPVMIADGNFVAVNLPTYGRFTGESHKGIKPTGKWLEYGMVNIVRLEESKIAESWFGMDPLVEMQQMGMVPSFPTRKLKRNEKANIKLFQKTINVENKKFDNLTCFDDIVVACSPPQDEEDTTTRKTEIYQVKNKELKLIYSFEHTINPPYSGDFSVDTESSRTIVKQFFEEVLKEHNLSVLEKIASSNILVHPTAMPCEATYYGINGVISWLNKQWKAFPDLTITDYFMVAQNDVVAIRWTAKGISKGKFLILKPSGKPVEFTGISMYRIEDDKIVEIWDTQNSFGIMRQINPKIGSGKHKH